MKPSSFASCKLLPVTLALAAGLSCAHAILPAGQNHFANAAVIPSATTRDISQATDLTPCTKEVGEPINSGGQRTAWWKWTAPSDGWVTFDTLNNEGLSGSILFDSTLGVFTGGSLGSLSTVETNDNASPTTHLSSLSFRATAGTTYHIQLDSDSSVSFGQAVLGFRFFKPQVQTLLASAYIGQAVHLNLTLNAAGSGSGRLSLQGRKHPLKGVVTTDGFFIAALARPPLADGTPQEPLVLTLDVIPFNNGEHTLWVEGVSKSPDRIAVYRTQDFPAEAPHALAPYFTAALKNGNGVSGHGFLTARVSAAGTVLLAGRTGDGKTFATSSRLCTGLAGTLVAPSGAGAPLFCGLLRFQDVAGGIDTLDSISSVNCMRLPAAKGSFYPKAVLLYYNLKGGAYTAPAAGQRALGFLNASSGAGTIGFETATDEYSAFSEPLQFGTDNRFSFGSLVRKPVLKLNPKTGLVTGSITEPATKTRKIYGILAHDSGVPRIHGLVTGTTRTGRFSVTP